MNAIRRADVTARVVAWHNRHPLARRIGPDHVGVVGVVALPFALAPGPAAPGKAQALMPLFGDDWMYRAAARRLGAWGRRHGVEALQDCEDWPSRAIDIDPALARAADARGLTARTLRHVLTAAIDADGRRTRVLLSAHGALRSAPVFGQRLPGSARLAALAGTGVALGACLGATAWWALGAAPLASRAVAVAQAPASSTPPPAAGAHSSADGDSASAAGGVASGAGGVVPAPADKTLAAAAAPESTIAARAAPATDPAAPADIARPLDTSPVLRLRDDGAPPLVDIRPRLSADDQQAARRQAAALRLPPLAGRIDGPVYAIATAPTRTRDDALAQQALLQGLLAQTVTAVPTRLDVMAARGRWRAVWWPHPRRDDAQALVQAARARGLTVELIAF